MELHRSWDGVITSSSNLTRLRNEATALRNHQEFQGSQLTELASTDFESGESKPPTAEFNLRLCSFDPGGAHRSYSDHLRYSLPS